MPITLLHHGQQSGVGTKMDREADCKGAGSGSGGEREMLLCYAASYRCNGANRIDATNC